MIARLVPLSALAVSLAVLAGASADDKPAELKVGDPAPTFQLRDEKNATWSSSDHVGKKWVVVDFYPGDFTPGCTAQAKAFKEAMNKLTDLGVEVVGVSGDAVQTHELFKKAEKLNFTLLSDEDGAVAKKFGVPVGKGGKVRAKDADGKAFDFERAVTAGRWTFVIGKDGNVAYKNAKVVPADDAKKFTQFVTDAEKK